METVDIPGKVIIELSPAAHDRDVMQKAAEVVLHFFEKYFEKKNLHVNAKSIEERKNLHKSWVQVDDEPVFQFIVTLARVTVDKHTLTLAEGELARRFMTAFPFESSICLAIDWGNITTTMLC